MSALDKRRERDAAKIAEVRARSAGASLTNRMKDGRPRTVKAGKYPDAARLAEVERLFLMLRPARVIVRDIAARFSVEERTVYNDLQRVRAEYAPTEDERKARRDQHRATLVRLMEEAEAEGDKWLARSIAADLAKLDGLNEPDRVEHSGTIQTGVLVVAPQADDAAAWTAQYGGPTAPAAGELEHLEQLAEGEEPQG